MRNAYGPIALDAQVRSRLDITLETITADDTDKNLLLEINEGQTWNLVIFLANPKSEAFQGVTVAWGPFNYSLTAQELQMALTLAGLNLTSPVYTDPGDYQVTVDVLDNNGVPAIRRVANVQVRTKVCSTLGDPRLSVHLQWVYTLVERMRRRGCKSCTYVRPFNIGLTRNTSDIHMLVIQHTA